MDVKARNKLRFKKYNGARREEIAAQRQECVKTPESDLIAPEKTIFKNCKKIKIKNAAAVSWLASVRQRPLDRHLRLALAMKSHLRTSYLPDKSRQQQGHRGGSQMTRLASVRLRQ